MEILCWQLFLPLIEFYRLHRGVGAGLHCCSRGSLTLPREEFHTFEWTNGLSNIKRRTLGVDDIGASSMPREQDQHMTSLPLARPRDIQGKWDGPLPIIEDLAMWTIAEDIPTYIHV